MTASNLLQKSFMDQKGRIVLTQKPNLALATWIVAKLLLFILPSGQPKNIISAVAFGALFTWSWLEALQGVNYFRRGLGVLVLVLLVVSKK